MPRYPFLPLLLLACSAPRSEPASAPPDRPAEIAVPKVPTPGFCGPWGQTDSAALAGCGQAMVHNPPPGYDSLFPGDCGSRQTVAVASVQSCLREADSAAAACPLVDQFEVRQADGVVRKSEWRRCGPQGGAFVNQTAVYPTHFLLIRSDSSSASPLIFAMSNREEEGAAGLDTVVSVDLDRDGSDELFYIQRIYGTGAAFEYCAIVVRAGKLRCWDDPGDPAPAAALRSGEYLSKGWIPVSDGPTPGMEPVPLTLRPGSALWFFTPVYQADDPNCCPSANASLWYQLIPRDGRFQSGLFVRATEDSFGKILRTDTLRY